MLKRPDLQTIYAAIAVTFGTFLLGFLFWNWRNTDPMWAVAAFVLVYDPDPRTAFGSGLSRMLYTLLGCLISVGVIFLFHLHKWLMPLGLGFTVFVCGYFFKFRGAWRALLVCVALVIGSSLMDASSDIHIAFTRGVEVAVGSALAILFSWPMVYFTRGRKEG